MLTKKRNKNLPIKILLCTVLILYAVILLTMLVWGLLTAVKTDDELLFNLNYIGLPEDWMTGRKLMPWQWAFNNFSRATQFFAMTIDNGETITFGVQVLNTILYSVGCAFLASLCPCIMAYMTSKFNYKFNAVIDATVIVTMILPIVGASVSMIDLMYKLKIYDTFFGLFCQKFNFVNMYYLVYSAVFKGVSKEYYEAAHIDGASEFNVFIRIAMPLVINSFGLVMLLFFIQFWNDFNTIMVYAPSHPTIIYSLYKIVALPVGNTDKGELPIQLASCIILVVPVIILFIIFRNKLMGNLTIGGVKE